MMFVMSLSVDSSLDAKSLGAHHQAITHTLGVVHISRESGFKGAKMLLFEAVGVATRSMNPVCTTCTFSPSQLYLFSTNFAVLTFYYSTVG